MRFTAAAATVSPQTGQDTACVVGHLPLCFCWLVRAGHQTGAPADNRSTRVHHIVLRKLHATQETP